MPSFANVTSGPYWAGGTASVAGRCDDAWKAIFLHVWYGSIGSP